MVSASNDDKYAPSEEALYRVAYVSTETAPLNTQDLLSLLSEVRAKNAAANLTGLLLHKGNAFFQVLEGPYESVDRVMAGIRNDHRHCELEVLLEGPIDERHFGEWRMGFVNLDTIDTRLVPGFSDFLNDGHEPRSLLRELSTSERLALMFKGMS